ncbi:hypothetical protein [Riemerella columbina]|uniref:hypothetical protein n=1 Tax=Riemerella columbina TaxID=103810 RepID=UPI00267058F6|nr:hypothetical protein [Riemerella columbina]WKS94305.1 SAP domain-containing protein [Riemerella columbina]
MTEQEFLTRYWYASELKALAKQLGIPHANTLRKDQLEQEIHWILKTGKVREVSLPKAKNLPQFHPKDSEKGLTPSLPIERYTSYAATKNFLIAQAQTQVPDFKVRSGVWYRLNRWREQACQERRITYGDLVAQLVSLNQSGEPFAQIPSTLMNNFISDYLKNEPNSTRQQAMSAWKTLKTLPIEKTYTAWKAYDKI